MAILPYYIANLNIEYTYREKTGRYLEFPNLCFVDTLDNLGWQEQRAETAREANVAVSEQQSSFNLGGLSVENWMRVQLQNEKTISVVIGNPPYNANQSNFNDFNPNRAYPEIDRRIRETYVAESMAQKTKQYDMYKRFLRWASDRLADDGIIAFITNRAYLDKMQDDGFRKVSLGEFSDLYIVDLGGDVRKNRRTGNVFGIMTGVAIGFFVRHSVSQVQASIHYYALGDEQSGIEKLSELQKLNVADLAFEDIKPDSKDNWLNQMNPDFERLLSLADRKAGFAKTDDDDQAMFGLHSVGISTNRDDWVYDFDPRNLRDKVLFFADTYNELMDNSKESYDTIIKWSDTTRNHFRHRRRIVYSDVNRLQSLYRPFIVKHYFADAVMNDRLTSNHYEMFGSDLKQDNRAICFQTTGARRPFAALATDKVADLHLFFDGAQCLPLHRYTPEGERVSNITRMGHPAHQRPLPQGVGQ